MKPYGYILFSYWHKCGKQASGIHSSAEHLETAKDLDIAHHNDFDDNWDYEKRHRIHYFYLDLSSGKYHPLPKWKNPPNMRDKFKSDEETEESTIYFQLEQS
jgi:hypothetical protein